MIIDDSIVAAYLSGQPPDRYKDHWVYSAIGRGHVFEAPNPLHRNWVSKLRGKLKNQIQNFVPRNYELVRTIFPGFDDIARDYTILLVVGFPDPYDAMVLNHNGREFMVFDLIQFGQDSLDEGYSCHRVLTHELIHICLHQSYPEMNLSYLDDLNYTVFDEGFAHALSYPEDIFDFEFSDFFSKKYEQARIQLKNAAIETNEKKQKAFRISVDTGDYWEKFGSIAGKLYLLKHKDQIIEIYKDGWSGFVERILNDEKEQP